MSSFVQTQDGKATKLLNAVTSTGVGSALKKPTHNVTIQATLGTAGTTTATVNAEVSNDLVGWIVARTFTLSGANDSDGQVINASWKYIRGNVTALGSGADVTMTMGG